MTRADLPRVVEADVRPGLAGVGRLVHAVAVRDLRAHVGFAGADVDDVRVATARRAMAPIDAIGCESKIGVQVRPALVVFHTPPPTEPK